jgi:hypothetical protein
LLEVPVVSRTLVDTHLGQDGVQTVVPLLGL